MALSGLEDVACTGISIVWSAHAGLAFCLLRSRAFRTACRLPHFESAILCLEAVAVVAWAYYAVVAGVRPGSYCSPRHPTHLNPYPCLLGLNGILCAI